MKKKGKKSLLGQSIRVWPTFTFPLTARPIPQLDTDRWPIPRQSPIHRAYDHQSLECGSHWTNSLLRTMSRSPTGPRAPLLSCRGHHQRILSPHTRPSSGEGADMWDPRHSPIRAQLFFHRSLTNGADGQTPLLRPAPVPLTCGP